jgi:hypothetical protein
MEVDHHLREKQLFSEEVKGLQGELGMAKLQL